jgi:plastocyanin
MGRSLSWTELALASVCILLSLGFQPQEPHDLTVTGQVEISTSSSHSKSKDSSKVVVWLKPLDPSLAKPAPPQAQVSLVQKNKSFEPRLLIIQVGTVVDFPNHDPFFHNVFSLYDGKRFDLGLYEAGTSRHVRFDRPGVCYIFCNIHPEMSAVVLVLDTPYYGLVNGAGTFRIGNVPPGRYELKVFDERALPEVLEKLTHEVVVSDTKQNVGVVKIAETDVSMAHKNKYGRDYDTKTASPTYIQP